MTRKGARDEYVKQLSDWEVGGKSGVRKDTENGQVKHFNSPKSKIVLIQFLNLDKTIVV